MVYSYSGKGGRQYPYYVCLNAQRKGWAACPVKSLSARAIEESVLEQIRQAQRGLSDPAEWERTNRAGQGPCRRQSDRLHPLPPLPESIVPAPFHAGEWTIVKQQHPYFSYEILRRITGFRGAEWGGGLALREAGRFRLLPPFRRGAVTLRRQGSDPACGRPFGEARAARTRARRPIYPSLSAPPRSHWCNRR